MTDTKKAFWEHKNTSFAEPDPRDDYLHPEAREREPGPSLTETQYFGFNIPEHDIHAFCYLWHHPNVGIVTGGALVWQGIKPTAHMAELWDWLVWVPDSVLEGDLHHVTLPNGYESEVLEPLKRFRVRYRNDETDNAFDVELEALAPPMVLESKFHLEQPMKTRGTLKLRGKDYEVDGYSVRDRSWGQLRPETSMALPPVSWPTGVFGPDLSFGTTGFDSENPDWQDAFPVPGGDPLRAGWICRDGVYSPVMSMSQKIHRNKQTLLPEAIDLTITDATGQSLEMEGTIRAASSFANWGSINFICCLTRWEYDGRVGWGDFQEVHSAEYVRQFAAVSFGTPVRQHAAGAGR